MDDENIRNIPLKSKSTTFSAKHREADFFINKIHVDLNGFSIKFTFIKEEFGVNINQPLPSYFNNFSSQLLMLNFTQTPSPGKNLTVIGVTGTDGKTTTVSLIYHILNQSGKKSSMLTSIGFDFDR